MLKPPARDRLARTGDRTRAPQPARLGPWP